jgi:hypothetical protein
LAILPKLSNDSREDKFSATEWLQKVINNKQGGGWTNLQTATHFKNALRDEVLKWYNALNLLKEDNLNWDIISPQFEQDYRVAPIISSVIQKLPEINQKDFESVIQYVSRCAKILLEFKC